MAFDSLGRYTPNHKTWDHVGNMIPVVEHSEGIRPAGEYKPAAWLPVQFYDKYYEEWFVILPGKILAMDNDGRLCPGGYSAATPLSITYTANDVDAGVIDVRTGVALITGGIGTVAVSAVANFMGRTGVAMTVSAPVAVAPYAYWQWAGDGGLLDDGFNPAGFRQHNHSLQHQTAILCDYVLELPLIPAVAASENLENDSFATTVLVLGPINNLPVAKNTVRTPITFANNTLTDSATRFVREVDTVADIQQLGDWHINLDTGMVSTWASADPGGGATAYAVSYNHYASAPTTVSKFASAVGNLKGGDFVLCDTNSNFAVADPAGTGRGTASFEGGDQFDQIMGQVLEVEDTLDKDALARVRTAYNPPIGTDASGSLPAYAGQMDQMPGSATGGATDKVHYAGAANLVVRINLISR